MNEKSYLLRGLKRAREHRGLSAEQLAELVGVSQRTIFRYESETKENRVPHATANALAEVLGTTVGALKDPTCKLGLETHLPDPNFPTTSDYCARFAKDDGDVEAVLSLRRKAFPGGTITPDESYRKCWSRTKKQGIRIVGYLGQPVGFWSMFPIEKQCFDNFIEGKTHLYDEEHDDFRLSHKNLLERFAMPWDGLTGNKAIYLYLAGVVAHPPKEESLDSIFHKDLAGRVILDMINVAHAIFQNKNVQGICGYPSIDGGLSSMRKMKVVPNGNYIDGDENHPICVSRDEEIVETREAIESKTKKRGYCFPFWEDDDMKTFLRTLQGPQ